jgi:hypothetical protein
MYFISMLWVRIINITSMLWSRTRGDWMKLLGGKQIYFLQRLQFIFYFFFVI